MFFSQFQRCGDFDVETPRPVPLLVIGEARFVGFRLFCLTHLTKPSKASNEQEQAMNKLSKLAIHQKNNLLAVKVTSNKFKTFTASLSQSFSFEHREK